MRENSRHSGEGRNPRRGWVLKNPEKEKTSKCLNAQKSPALVCIAEPRGSPDAQQALWSHNPSPQKFPFPCFLPLCKGTPKGGAQSRGEANLHSSGPNTEKTPYRCNVRSHRAYPRTARTPPPSTPPALPFRTPTGHAQLPGLGSSAWTGAQSRRTYFPDLWGKVQDLNTPEERAGSQPWKCPATAVKSPERTPDPTLQTLTLTWTPLDLLFWQITLCSLWSSASC